MTETQFQPGDKVVLLPQFDFHLNGIGFDVPVHGKVYCVSEVRSTGIGTGLIMAGMQHQVGPCGNPCSFEARCFKKISQ